MYEDEYYSTTDLALTAALSIYYPIDSIDRVNPQKVLFIFKRDTSLDEFIQAYWRQEIKVEPQMYFNQLKLIKARLYGEK